MKKKNHFFIYGLVSAIVLLLSGILIYRAYSFYEEKSSFDLIRGEVQDQNYDVSLVYVLEDKSGNQVMSETIPEGRDYYVTVDCNHEAKGSWDYEKWAPLIENLGQSRTKCKVNFAPSKPLFSDVIKSVPVVTSGSGLYQVNHPDSEISVSFSDELSEDEKGNLKKTELRYAGVNPNNYVLFNDELWRVIGLVNTPEGQRVKLVNDSSFIGTYDSSDVNVNEGHGVNEWGSSKVEVLLNEGAYYNRKIGNCSTGKDLKTEICDFSENGLHFSSKKMIDMVTWNIGSNGSKLNTDEINSKDAYNLERSNNTGKICTGGSLCSDNILRHTTWYGDVGLLYPSDYGYATSGGEEVNRAACLNSFLGIWHDSSLVNCKENDWLYNENKSYLLMFNAIHYEMESASHVYYIAASGRLTSHYASQLFHVRPVVYLKENVRVISGDGSEDNPYTLMISC